MIEIFPIPAFLDNYIWALYNQSNRKLAVVDPGTAAPVLGVLEKLNATLSCILITHHHRDHTGGMKTLLNNYHVPVYGPANEAIDSLSIKLKETQSVTLEDFDLKLEVLDVPGHTRGHIAYFCSEGWLFCGDTLFGAGCGRLFEGTAAQLYHSLTKLAKLPEPTEIYCAHEYTLANLNFAKAVEPANDAVLERLEWVKHLRQHNKVSLPSTLEIEKKTNPFLRCHTPLVKAAAENYCQHALATPSEVFAQIRNWKDNFSG